MVDPNSRMARELDTRENAQRTREWVPPQTLPTPTPKPGVVYRWIRTSFLGQNDPTNTSAKIREGWEPCKAADHPELALNIVNPNNVSGNVEIGGLMLCKAPAELMAQRDRYYRKQAEGQMEAVDNSFMQTEDKRMPLFKERNSKTSFGRGNK